MSTSAFPDDVLGHILETGGVIPCTRAACVCQAWRLLAAAKLKEWDILDKPQPAVSFPHALLEDGASCVATGCRGGVLLFVNPFPPPEIERFA